MRKRRTFTAIRSALPDEVVWARRNESYTSIGKSLGVDAESIKLALQHKWTRDRTGKFSIVPCAVCDRRTAIRKVDENRVCDECRPPVEEPADPPWLEDYRWGLEVARRRRKATATVDLQ